MTGDSESPSCTVTSQLTAEDARLRRLLAERDLEVDALKERRAEKQCRAIDAGRRLPGTAVIQERDGRRCTVANAVAVPWARYRS